MEEKRFFGKIPDKKTIIIIGSCVLAVAVITVVLCLCLRRSDPEEQSVISAETITGDPSITVAATPTPVPTATVAPTVTPTPEPSPTPLPAPKEHTNEIQSALNGEWKSKEITDKRPYCIMFNNIEAANPQSGISCADILYEALTEGGITRMMGVFEGLDDTSTCKDRIGSVRSARHYFASFADEYDSIFIHYGETTYATKKIAALSLDHLEGTYGIGDTVFYRDKTIKAPHNAFASLEGIHKGIEKMKFRTEHASDWTPNHFIFTDPDLEEYEEQENGNEIIAAIISDPAYLGSGRSHSSIKDFKTSDASLVQLNYSKYMSPYLDYSEETGLYTRHQYNDVHIDYNTQQPLTFKNIIIQIVHEFDKDKNGYQDMELHNAKGNGYYITEGKCIPITWEKNEDKHTMRYLTEDGNILAINNGRTFISVYPDFRLDKLKIE